MRFSLDKQMILVSIAFLALAAAIGFWVIYPAVLQIKEVDETTYNLRVFLERKNLTPINPRSAAAQLAELKAAAADFRAHLFYRGSELELITLLENSAARRNVTQKIQNSNLDTQMSDHIDLTVVITGNYSNVLYYLKDLEALPHFFIIQNLRLAPAPERQAPAGSIQLNLGMSLYVNK